ncbi:hypothetical protein DH2020_025464 [Rehmannia glutinosa]|uniref:BTB domain-containing protein n=1 Tax=Rehmannia glutinosa TaxID=99300 RepID=A0ABR0VZP2_REHGL
MDEHTGTDSIKFGDPCTSDITICLKNSNGRQELFHSHSSILKSNSTYFADRLSDPSFKSCLEIECTDVNYEHHLKLLKCLYLPAGSLLDAWDCVRSALGVLQVAVVLCCESIVNSCIRYLEAVPWEENEEEEISTVHALLSRRAEDFAQEQVEYMLGDDEDMPLVAADNEVKLETRTGLAKTFSSFERELSSLLESDICDAAEDRMTQCLSDLEWMCNILLKMGLMNDFVSKWIDISENVLRIMEDKKFGCIMWGSKVKLIEVTSKVLDAVGYGNVILPAPRRVQLLNSWLPFIRKIKPILESMNNKDIEFPYKMDEDLCQSIEGAIVSLVSALPSNDQAGILADWMNDEQLKYPDLSEAFEVWCFRTKSAKRRLVGGLDRVNTTVTL